MLGELNDTPHHSMKTIEDVFEDLPVNSFHYSLLFMAGAQCVNKSNSCCNNYIFIIGLGFMADAMVMRND